jgi:hypothetical protein
VRRSNAEAGRTKLDGVELEIAIRIVIAAIAEVGTTMMKAWDDANGNGTKRKNTNGAIGTDHLTFPRMMIMMTEEAMLMKLGCTGNIRNGIDMIAVAERRKVVPIVIPATMVALGEASARLTGTMKSRGHVTEANATKGQQWGAIVIANVKDLDVDTVAIVTTEIPPKTATRRREADEMTVVARSISTSATANITRSTKLLRTMKIVVTERIERVGEVAAEVDRSFCFH